MICFCQLIFKTSKNWFDELFCACFRLYGYLWLGVYTECSYWFCFHGVAVVAVATWATETHFIRLFGWLLPFGYFCHEWVQIYFQCVRAVSAKVKFLHFSDVKCCRNTRLWAGEFLITDHVYVFELNNKKIVTDRYSKRMLGTICTDRLSYLCFRLAVFLSYILFVACIWNAHAHTHVCGLERINYINRIGNYDNARCDHMLLIHILMQRIMLSRSRRST